MRLNKPSLNLDLVFGFLLFLLNFTDFISFFTLGDIFSLRLASVSKSCFIWLANSLFQDAIAITLKRELKISCFSISVWIIHSNQRRKNLQFITIKNIHIKFSEFELRAITMMVNQIIIKFNKNFKFEIIY